MKIDVYEDMVEMIHKDISPGAYGTKYGADGCMYSIPGDGDTIYKFDVQCNKVTIFYKLQKEQRAKYAGGVTRQDGSMLFAPATAKSIMQLKPKKDILIPNSIYKFFFTDNY